MKYVYPLSKNYESLSVKQAQEVSQSDSPAVMGQSASQILTNELHQLDKALGWAENAAKADPKYNQSVSDIKQAIQLLNKAIAGLGNSTQIPTSKI